MVDARKGFRSLKNMRDATWYVSSMVGRSGEVVDCIDRRKIDLWCAQETRWKGRSSRMLGAICRGYKFFWQGCNRRTAGVGVFIAEGKVTHLCAVHTGASDEGA